MKIIFRTIIHILYSTWKNTIYLKEFAKNIHNKKILEIGSGYFPAERFFDKTNTFIKSDLNSQFGFRMIDVAKMNIRDKFDIIICCHVLDDVFDYDKAVDNIYVALKKRGTAFVIVNGLYPLHDIPYDYWRFTEYSLPKIFSRFRKVIIKRRGLKSFPISYSVIAYK